ncbi:MAG: hypothetical protein UY19_C0021G0006 [Candidatus Wolfebacteria bacterium GW2011_GWA2_47_9b]|uniref:Uncharacterized protein n=1 Tax=Candidatus Wolfebacteria bacterium GW2011_GWA2_47_9b TaxID=1619005 RepID=A0A0G1U4H6_9BACT|nr:MAG: hypothetical protein UY19_C0021G0006 [Candidatus Wolfebacteria bacterium GW2011_GWA2_47_9b]
MADFCLHSRTVTIRLIFTHFMRVPIFDTYDI